MPREFVPIIRKGGFQKAEKFFVLAFEGRITERKYFEDLRTSSYFNDTGKIETIPLKKPKPDDSHPIHVKNILLRARNDYGFRSTDEFWLIIDRDDWQTQHHVDFQKIAEECKKYGNVFLALSNPCFEIWLLLHLIQLKDIDENSQRKIFENKKINKNKNYIDKYLADCMDGRGYTKRPNPSVFLGKIPVAIRNARSIAIDGEDYPHGLGTDVYKLVEKLVKDNTNGNKS